MAEEVPENDANFVHSSRTFAFVILRTATN